MSPISTVSIPLRSYIAECAMAHQRMETGHTAQTGLARRIALKAGSEATAPLDLTDEYRQRLNTNPHTRIRVLTMQALLDASPQRPECELENATALPGELEIMGTGRVHEAALTDCPLCPCFNKWNSIKHCSVLSQGLVGRSPMLRCKQHQNIIYKHIATPQHPMWAQHKCLLMLDPNNEHVSVQSCVQVLGRNLEGVVNRAMELKDKWGDQYVSVEHLVLALADDPRFGATLFKNEGLTNKKLEEVRGTLGAMVSTHANLTNKQKTAGGERQV
eukprot:scaffold174465_cov20-Tisochrysis_lutea.AAC.1